MDITTTMEPVLPPDAPPAPDFAAAPVPEPDETPRDPAQPVPDPPARPATRSYVVLAGNTIDDEGTPRTVYGVVGQAEVPTGKPKAATERAAISKVVPDDVPGIFVAIPAKDWNLHVGLSNSSTVTKPDDTQETIVSRAWG